MFKYCKQCGLLLKDDQRFCEQCGMKVTESDDQQEGEIKKEQKEELEQKQELQKEQIKPVKKEPQEEQIKPVKQEPQQQSVQKSGMGNRKYKGLRILFIVLLVFVGLFILGFTALNSYEGYNEVGFYIFLILILLGIMTCLALVPMFMTRRKNFNKAFNPETQFAYWHVDEKLVLETAKEKLRSDKQRNKSIFILMTVVWVICAVLLAFELEDEGLIMFVIIMILSYGFVGIFAFAKPYIAYKTIYLKATDVYLGENAVVIGKEFHIFNSFIVMYKSAEYDQEKRLILIAYKSLSRTGWVEYSARIPVPHEQETLACEYVNWLENIHNREG